MEDSDYIEAVVLNDVKNCVAADWIAPIFAADLVPVLTEAGIGGDALDASLELTEVTLGLACVPAAPW